MQNLKKYTIEEIESYEGYYDGSLNYILEDGDYFDQNGFYFDPDGYDENGGYFDHDLNMYVTAEMQENWDFQPQFDADSGFEMLQFATSNNKGSQVQLKRALAHDLKQQVHKMSNAKI